MKKTYDNYQTFEEAFRHLVVQSVQVPGRPITVPVLEQHPLAPDLAKYREDRKASDRKGVMVPPKPPSDSDFAVVYLAASEEYGTPVTEKTRVNGEANLELNVCDIQALTMSVEFCGIEARNLGLRSKLWMDSEPGIQALLQAGVHVQSISGIRALDEFIDSGKSWERRAQYDVDVLVGFSQEPDQREVVGLVEQPVLKVCYDETDPYIIPSLA